MSTHFVYNNQLCMYIMIVNTVYFAKMKKKDGVTLDLVAAAIAVVVVPIIIIARKLTIVYKLLALECRRDL